MAKFLTLQKKIIADFIGVINFFTYFYIITF